MTSDERYARLRAMTDTELAAECRNALADSIPPRWSAEKRCQEAWVECRRRGLEQLYQDARDAVRAERRRG